MEDTNSSTNMIEERNENQEVMIKTTGFRFFPYKITIGRAFETIPQLADYI